MNIEMMRTDSINQSKYDKTFESTEIKGKIIQNEKQNANDERDKHRKSYDMDCFS